MEEEMMNQLSTTNSQHCYGKRVSWSAIVVGALVMIGLNFLVNVFSASTGLAAFTTNQDGLTSLAIGGFIGMLIGVIAVMFVGGWLAGYLGKSFSNSSCSGITHGFAAWCLALVITIVTMTQFAQFVSNNLYSMTEQTPGALRLTTGDKPPLAAQQTKNNTDTSNIETSVNAEKAANNLGNASFGIFILFLAGAITSCFGGYYGYRSQEKQSAQQ